jgi:glycosyltransferase involved in cell wall biosynthesis
MAQAVAHQMTTMDSQGKVDIPKLRICMLLSVAFLGQDVTIPLDKANWVAKMSHLADFGHQVTWIVGVRPEAQDQVRALFPDKVRVCITPQIRYFPGAFLPSRMLNTVPNTIKRMRAVLRIFREAECNIILVRQNTFDRIITACVKRKYDVPFILWPPESLEMQGQRARIASNKPSFLSSPLARFNKFVLLRLLHQADLVLVTSKVQKERLADWGIDGAKMMPLPSGVDVEAFSPRDGSAIRKRYTLSDSKVVIYLGIMTEQRKLGMLIRAFSQVKRHVPDAKLLMVGDGADRANLESLAWELRLSEDILFPGRVPYGDVPDFIAAADVTLVAVPPLSFYKMGSPLKLFEYMAMAKPVVATEEIPEHREVLEQSGGGILVPYASEAFASAMIKLLGSPETAAEMGRKGRDWVVKNRSDEILARQMEKACLKLLIGRQ